MPIPSRPHARHDDKQRIVRCNTRLADIYAQSILNDIITKYGSVDSFLEWLKEDATQPECWV